MEEKQMEQDRQASAQEQAQKQAYATRKLLKLNLIEIVSNIFDDYEKLLQEFIKLNNENKELKRLLVDKEKEPLPVNKEKKKKNK